MKQKKILIVDDDPNIRILLSLNIGAAGYETFTAENGLKGLELIKQDKPDLIVLDVMMPQMDGWEICKIIKDHSDLQSIKILMLTAKNAERDKMIGRHILKADDYMTKPFDITELLQSIEKLLAAPE